MFDLGRRAALICSVLLTALLISCGGPSPPPPATPPAAQGGLQEVQPSPVQAVPAEPAPAAPPPPAVAPAPGPPVLVPVPAPVPASPRLPERPGGGPGGLPLPEANVNPLGVWLAQMKETCIHAGYDDLCIKIEYRGADPRKAENPDDCKIAHPPQTKYVKPNSTIVLTLDKDSCLPSERHTNDEPSPTGGEPSRIRGSG